MEELRQEFGQTAEVVHRQFEGLDGTVSFDVVVYRDRNDRSIKHVEYRPPHPSAPIYSRGHSGLLLAGALVSNVPLPL